MCSSAKQSFISFQETNRRRSVRSSHHPVTRTPRLSRSKTKRSDAASLRRNRYWERRAPRATQKRNLRSKIWWFTESCNSHYVSHFAAFFIVARAKISIAKSCTVSVVHSKQTHWKETEASVQWWKLANLQFYIKWSLSDRQCQREVKLVNVVW